MALKVISEETRDAILAAAWDLIATQGRASVGQAEIAAAAGVSRQTVFYAFGARSGLLTAMVRYQDARSPVLARLLRVANSPDLSNEALIALIEAWLDYLPEVYPVGVLLDAAGLTDPEARAAIDDRMVNAWLGGLTGRLSRMRAAGTLRVDLVPESTAQLIWESLHFPAWRLLVVQCGWSPQAFAENRLAAVRRLLAIGADGKNARQ